MAVVPGGEGVAGAAGDADRAEEELGRLGGGGVNPESGAVLLPLPVWLWSNVPVLARPENSSAVTARLLEVDGNVTVMVFPLARAFTLWAERTTVRTVPALAPEALTL